LDLSLNKSGFRDMFQKKRAKDIGAPLIFDRLKGNQQRITLWLQEKRFLPIVRCVITAAGPG
jgi:hypothetical protein